MLSAKMHYSLKRHKHCLHSAGHTLMRLPLAVAVDRGAE